MLRPYAGPYVQPLQGCSPTQVNMWFINKRRRVRAQLKGGTHAVRRTRKPRAHRAVQHREDTDAPANNPAVVVESTFFGLCSDLESPRGRSTLPNVQHNASAWLSSYCSQSAGTLSDGSDWNGLVSSDCEDHASACTSPTSLRAGHRQIVHRHAAGLRAMSWPHRQRHYNSSI